MAVCNGNLDSVSDLGSGYKIWHWNMKNIIPSYLASVAVSEYALYSDVYNGINANIPIQIYVRPQDTTKVRTSFINLKNILAIFESNFGPYLWQRVGYVGVPFDNGAMEHATTIAYPNACIDGTLNYESLYAHELSHHWFGDLITCSKASEMWINEGWAEFCEFYYTKILYGNNYYKDIMRKELKSVLQFSYIEDGGNYFALGDIPHEYTYGYTSYHKGNIVINTLGQRAGVGHAKIGGYRQIGAARQKHPPRAGFTHDGDIGLAIAIVIARRRPPAGTSQDRLRPGFEVPA